MNTYTSFYENPQIDNGITISKAMTNDNCVGLLMHNYKPKFMEIPKLNTLTYNKLHKRLRNSANKFIKKDIISSNESWLSIRENEIVPLTNKDVEKIKRN
jgi:hypothetical protein